MRGRVQLDSHRCRSLRRISSQHMRTTLPLATTDHTIVVQGDHRSSSSSITTITSDSFFKDGRKISVGDCALFKPPQDSPPFIGIIRSLTSGRDTNLTLGVNWLYRPAEIKLGKDTIVEGAPNEIFYSFHRDEAPAASLLHPCKVAFLPKGVGLPAGTSSFVCRRVYDITNKCLWWLTDQDYINDRQEEVNKLLYKTSVEMHATLQRGGRSPKQVNGPTSTSQLKVASESVQNSGATLHSQVKGKKKVRGDHGADSVKRESILRSDDGDPFPGKPDSNLISDIARITEGGLTDLEGVEKLVQLMLRDRTEKRMNLGSRSLLAGVVASTDKIDCLNRFVQLRGLPVLDEWLQEIHKGKIGDGNNLKDSDKSIEEFLLVLLRALDKLPVNLHSLQMCNVGKSVNHLRSHKNIEIQRKARSLVDTWKKRVEAEMNSIDAKTKSRLPDAYQSMSRTPSGSGVVMKSSVTQNSTSKTTSARSSHGESSVKSATASPGHVKSASSPSFGKESHPRISLVGTPDAPLIREDRSSSSNQSHNYVLSSGKEDGKSNLAGLMSVNKTSSSSTRNWKTSHFPGSTVTGNQKEISSSRSSSVHKVTSLEKSPSGSEKALEGPIIDGGSHMLIVKIPNRVHSAAQGVVAGRSGEDSTYVRSHISSPALSEHEHFDRTSEEKGEAFSEGSDMNADSWQNDDPKDALTGSAYGAASPAVLPNEEPSMSSEVSRRLIDDSSTNQLKSRKLHESSFSPMNALIESCVKYSEANASFSIDDDVGMKLLASVATRDMSKSDLISPADSTERSLPAVQESCLSNEARSKSSPANSNSGAVTQFSNATETDDKIQTVFDGGVRPEDGLLLPKQATLEFSVDKKCTQLRTPEVLLRESDNHFDSSIMDVKDKAEPEWSISVNSKEKRGTTSSKHPTVSTDKDGDGESNKGTLEEKVTSVKTCSDGITNSKPGEVEFMKTEEKVSIDSKDQPIFGDVAVDESSEDELKNSAFNTGSARVSLTYAIIKPEFMERTRSEKMQQTACTRNSVSEAGDVDKVEGRDEKEARNYLGKCERLNFHMEVNGNAADEIHNPDGLCSSPNEPKDHHETSVENKESMDHLSASEGIDPGSMVTVSLGKNEFEGSRSAKNRTDEAREHASSWAEASVSAAEVSDTDAKIKLDLNEGFSADEGKYGELVNLTSSNETTVHINSSLPFSVSSAPNRHTACITFAAAAKGPFVPPVDLLRSKSELGWKGSAATSAFRPAEPRRAPDMPSMNISSPDASTSRQGRLLDIDLNVPDEKVVEEMGCRDTYFVDSTENVTSSHDTLQNDALGFMSGRSSGGLDLDLNRVDGASESGNCSISGNHKGEGPIMHVKSFGFFPTGDACRNFNLNDGPGADDGVEPFSTNQQVKGCIPSQLSSLGLRVNRPGQGGLTSWFAPGTTYSSIAVPSMLLDGEERSYPVFPASAPQRAFSPSGVTTFTPDLLRGSLLPSSPAEPFRSSPFQFPVLPFGTTFPLPSATFPVGATSYVDSSSGPRLFAPPVHSQYLGSIGSVASQFHRPYVGFPDNTNNGLESSRKWVKHGLDLNAGPTTVESEDREEMFQLSSGQHSVANSQAHAEEQTRMYSVTSGILKRKEPEGGWENESYRLKQSSWH